MPRAATKKKTDAPSSMASLREKLTKKYGAAVVRREEVTSYDVIPTGSLTLDLAHRTGGWVVGRIHEIVGTEGVGKTSLCICSMVEAQKKYPDKAVGYIDMEQAFDYEWAEGLGLITDDDRFLHVYPNDSEDVSDQLKEMIETGLFSLVVVDSIGGMESKEAFDKEAAEKTVGRNAQVITRMVKRCAVLCRRKQVTVLLVNQLRANIGNPQGSDVSAGPKALRYSTTTKVDMRRTSDDSVKTVLVGDSDPVEIGRKIRARVVRSKVAVQGKAAEFYLFNASTDEYGPVGIDRADEAITIGVLANVIRRRGSWYYMDGPDGEEVGFQGRAPILAHLRSCPDDTALVREQALGTAAHEVIPEIEVTAEHEAEQVSP